MAQVSNPWPSVLECFKSVFNMSFVGRPVSSEDPRILQAADVFFDRRVHAALETLQYDHEGEEELGQQKGGAPSLESSSYTDESSSESSDDGAIDELMEMPTAMRALPARSQVVRHTMKRSRKDDDVRGRRNEAVITLKSSGNEDRLALTLAGSKGLNQDCGMVVHPLLVDREEPTLLLGVLDGHAAMGHLVSEHCRLELEKYITSHLESMEPEFLMQAHTSKVIADHLARLVEEVDRCIPRNMSRYGGTTFSSVLQLGDTVYLLNTGDSMSMLCAYVPKTDLCFVLETTEQHVPEVTQERERILSAGGCIGPQGYIHYELDEEEYGISMSRALGGRGAPGVIATPDIKILSISKLKDRVVRHFPVDNQGNALNPSEDVCLLGVSVSDGVLDVTDQEELAHCLTRAFFGPYRPSTVKTENRPQSGTLHPMVAVERLIQSCARRWKEEYNGIYRDDITIAAAKLS